MPDTSGIKNSGRAVGFHRAFVPSAMRGKCKTHAISIILLAFS
jgi:hypothetical protein